MNQKNLNLINYRGKHKGKTGYTLHLNRINHIGTGKLTRAIKYPLYSDDQLFVSTITDYIMHDSLHLMGSQTLFDYHQNSTYSVLDFWLDSLRIGGIFQYSYNALIDFVYKYSGFQSPFDNAIIGLKPKYENCIKPNEFIKLFYIKKEFRGNSSVDSIEKQVLSVFKFKDEDKSKFKEESFEFAKKIYKKNQKEQKKLINEFFGTPLGIDMPKDNNLTYYILPDLHINRDSSIEEILNSHNKVDLFKYSTPEELLGIGENGKALSNFLGSFLTSLQKDNTETIINKMIEICPDSWNKDNLKILEEKIVYLKSCANKLVSPKMVNSWAAYYTTLGGKLSQWLTNYTNREQEIANHLQESSVALSEFRNLIVNNYNNSKTERLLTQIDDLLIFANKSITERGINSDSYRIFQELLSTFRETTNALYQSGEILGNEIQVIIKENSKKYKSKLKNFENVISTDSDEYRNSFPITEHKVIKPLFKTFKKQVSFYGESSKLKFKKYSNSIDIIKSGIAITKGISNFLFIEERHFAKHKEDCIKFLDTIQNNYFKATTNHYKNTYKSILVPNIIKEVQSDYHFQTNKYKKRNLQYKEYKLPNYQEFLIIINSLENLLKSQNFTSEVNEIMDFVELSKSVLFFKLKVVEIDDFNEIKNLSYKNFDLIKFYFTQKESLTREDLTYALSKFYFSEFRGVVSMLSQKNITFKYSVLPLDSQKYFRIFIEKLKNRKNIFIDESVKYKLNLKTPKLPVYASNLLEENEIYYSKDKKSKVVEATGKFKQGFLKNNLQIRTSKYQLNLLHKSLINSKDFEIERKDPTLLVEINAMINWNYVESKFGFEQVNKKMFLIQPFEIKKSKEKKKEILKKGRYLGIDIGEYGIAYCVYNAVIQSVIDTGFIYDKQLRLLKDHYNELRANSKIGIFNGINERLANARETTIGTLRNRIHDLCLKYEAVPVYERQVSAFETGSGKVRKIYDSLKRADTFAEIEAEKTTKVLVWGTEKVSIGKEINAYGTSQTCSKCRLSALHEFKRDDVFTIKKAPNKDDYIGEAEMKSNSKIKVKFYCNINELSSDYQGMFNLGVDISWEFLKDYVNKYMRPPIESKFLIEILKQNNLDIKMNGIWSSSPISNKSIKEQLLHNVRGNSAIFVCPFCGHLSDADVQAALNIAVKGYLMDLKKLKKEELDFFEEIKKNNNLYPQSPIELTPLRIYD